jgi:hypothetical protein
MKLSSLIAPLLDAKVDHELIRQAIVAFELAQGDALEKRRESDRLRQEKRRMSRESREPSNVSRDRSLAGAGVTRVEDKTSNSEIEPQEESKKRAQDALREEFDTAFWPEYPNKVGKPKALAAYRTARKHAGLSAILDGLRRYIASKPPDRAWLNPATFLNQQRWADQPAVVVPMARAGPARRPHLTDFLNERFPSHDDSRPPETTVLNLPARLIG